MREVGAFLKLLMKHQTILHSIHSMFCSRNTASALSTLWVKDEPYLASNTYHILNCASFKVKVYDNDQRGNTNRK